MFLKYCRLTRETEENKKYTISIIVWQISYKNLLAYIIKTSSNFPVSFLKMDFWLCQHINTYICIY